MSTREQQWDSGCYTTTYSGVKFHPLDPDPADIRLVDIAHALSQQCRFNGHIVDFYSVAQHSVAVSVGCDESDAVWGVLHDAGETWLGDIPRPIKHSGRMEVVREIEDALMLAVCERFGLDPVQPASVKAADTLELVTEAYHLMIDKGVWWMHEMEVEPRPGPIVPLIPTEARALFLHRCDELEIK